MNSIKMTPDAFTKYWEATYPTSPPIGHLLRDAYPEIWFRIHTLPQSKRYAETGEERREILRRHNLLLSDLLTEGGEYVVTSATYSENSKPAQEDFDVTILGERRHYLFSYADPESAGDDDPIYVHLFMTIAAWKQRSADDLLGRVADDQMRDVLFVGVAENFVYHPYDGGADIFVIDEPKRTALKNKYSDWFSTHPSGL